jgi:hypothetical protein
MNVQRLPVSRLNPAPYNPRVSLQSGDPRWEKLARSLSEFDLVQPIVWNERTGHVVAGHQRLEVLKHQGATEVDCVVVDLPLEREQALNVTLNNPEVAGDWDPEKLFDLLAELQALPDVDATLTGFDEQQIRDYTFAPDNDLTPNAPSESETDEEQNHVEATLQIPLDLWDDVRPTLDTLLADHPTLRLHVTLPSTERP